jgi:CubicO group peptidase (beta-lactamase class C family)
MIRISLTLALGLLITLTPWRSAAIQAQTAIVCGAPLPLEDGWRIDTPEAAGFDRSRLCGLADRLQDADDVHGVIVARHGRLIFERYFAGYDEPWGHDDKRDEFDATMKHDMRSVSKSVVPLLAGIAIDRGLIEGVDAPVLPFFPEMASAAPEGWTSVKLRDVLTMSSGISWDENRPWTDPKNDEPHLGSEADPMRMSCKRVEAMT